MRRIGEGLACAISLTIDQTFCLAVSITPPMLPELSTQKTMSMCGRAISGTLTYGGLSKFGRFSSRSLPRAVGAPGHAADANTPATSAQAHFAVHVRFMIPPSVSRFGSVGRTPPREVSARRGRRGFITFNPVFTRRRPHPRGSGAGEERGPAMRILLVNPPYQTITSNFGVGHQIPLGLLMIGGPLIDAGHDVRLLDAECRRLSIEDVVREVAMFEPDIVMTGHAGSTPAHPVCMEMLRAIKSARPAVITVYGGVYPTYHAKEILGEQGSIQNRNSQIQNAKA